MSFIRLTDIVRRTWTEFQARKCFFSPKIEPVHFGTKCRLKAVTLNLAIYIYQLDHLRKKTPHRTGTCRVEGMATTFSSFPSIYLLREAGYFSLKNLQVEEGFEA